MKRIGAAANKVLRIGVYPLMISMEVASVAFQRPAGYLHAIFRFTVATR
jgi:hypothetical protein